jgi:hypothetical protein
MSGHPLMFRHLLLWLVPLVAPKAYLYSSPVFALIILKFSMW